MEILDIFPFLVRLCRLNLSAVDLPTKISILNLLLLFVSAVIVIVSIWISHVWNRRKVSQEALNGFVFGELPNLNARIRIDYKCNIYDKDNNYKAFIETLPKKDLDGYKDTMLRILNLFEVISINIENKIINEKICFEYISLVLTKYHKWCIPLIEEYKELANDKRVYEHVSKLAEKWNSKIRMKNVQYPSTNKNKIDSLQSKEPNNSTLDNKT